MATRYGRFTKKPIKYGFDEEPKLLNLNFFTLTGKKYTLQIDNNKLIGELCDKYTTLTKKNTFWANIVIIYNRNRLNTVNNIYKTLKELNIVNNTTFHIVLNLGGPSKNYIDSIKYSYDTWTKCGI
jgi:hypothetical protein